jgi:hypothetical protein
MKFLALILMSLIGFVDRAPAQDNPRESGKARAHQRGLTPPRIGSPIANLQASPAGNLAGPRPPSPQASNLFHSSRTILTVNGIPISSTELQELVDYWQSYRREPVDLLLRDAVVALLPLKVMEAKYADQIPTMKTRIQTAMAALNNGANFATVVKDFSDDSEAPTDDGRYTFGRGIAVQPFDRIAHSGNMNQIQGPFLTVYGWHFLEIVDYQRGITAEADETEVRHVLVMFPEMVALEKSGVDLRAWIKKETATAKIKILDTAFQNILSPKLRRQIEKQGN